MKQEKPGVYKITNTANGRTYYGSTKDVSKRWNEHLNNLKGNRHENNALQGDYCRFGPDSFRFEILQELLDKKERASAEKALIEADSACYNSVGTDQYREKMRRTKTGRKRVRPVTIEDVTYPSVKAAASALGVHESTVRKRILRQRALVQK